MPAPESKWIPGSIVKLTRLMKKNTDAFAELDSTKKGIPGGEFEEDMNAIRKALTESREVIGARLAKLKAMEKELPKGGRSRRRSRGPRTTRRA